MATPRSAHGPRHLPAYRTGDDLAAGRPLVDADLGVDGIVAGERPFVSALLAPGARELLTRLRADTVPARELVSWRIGYVCGDKRFFHPDEATRTAFALPAASLRPALAGSRALRGIGLRTSAVPEALRRRLFLPPGDGCTLTEGERRYLVADEHAGVADRYKCRVRTPWYVTPGVRTPDVVLPVFSERPVLILDDAGLVASNSLLCGYVRPSPPSCTLDALAAAWFTSLTVLQFELRIHALGGEVMVVVPREAGSLRLPVLAAPDGLVAELHRLLAADRAGTPSPPATTSCCAAISASWRPTSTCSGTPSPT